MNVSTREFNTTLNTGNSSDTTRVNVLLDIGAWFSICSILATLVFNALILTIYIRRPPMRTPFNVYIANLAITEIILAVGAMPLSLIRVLYGYWPYNAISCSWMIYSGQGFGAAIRYCHILITANRFWAVTFPISYKNHHSTRLAKVLVVTMWIFIHALNLPVMIRGRLMKGTAAVDRECLLGTEGQFHHVLAVELLSFTIPECLIVSVYLFITFHLWKRRRARFFYFNRAVVVPSLPGSAQTSKEISENYGTGPNSLRFKSHNRVLAYLVIAVVLCWTPNHVYYLLVDITGYWNQTFFAVQYFAQYSNSWLNPILIYLADSQFRREINLLFRPS